MSRKTNRNKDPNRRAIPFSPKMNPLREELLKRIDIAMAAHMQREEAGDFRHFDQAMDFNREFVERSRGKGKGKHYIKSVALQRRPVSKYQPHQGASECARRAG